MNNVLFRDMRTRRGRNGKFVPVERDATSPRLKDLSGKRQ